VEHAEAEKNKYEAKAKWTGLALNAAIGLQVLIGALITGLSAVTTGRHVSGKCLIISLSSVLNYLTISATKTSIMTSIMGESTVNHLRLLRTQSLLTKTKGGLSTVVASYLARARGSNEPELSITRVKDLEQFLRECKAFSMDHGQTLGNEYDAQLDGLRQRFEELLGNANG
jgi:hypothetical protein